MRKWKILVTLLMLMTARASAAENVHFSGTLVALPCTIPDSDRTIKVSMGNVNAHDLYLHQTMPRVPFILHLKDCDPTITGKVSVTFAGTEDAALPGDLALDSGQSSTSGIAIGLESSSGEQIKVNEATSSYTLLTGNNEIAFQAFIAAEPDEIKAKSIIPGNFSAIAILTLDYS